jgi:tRNA(Ile)-lysidine synthase
MKNSLKFAFLEFVNHHQLITPGQRVLIAVSGGIDSMVLLHLMLNWQQYFKIHPGVAHFNHRLRGKDSDQDEVFVRTVCEKNKIPFFSGRGEVKKYARKNKYSIEEAARLLREDFLETCRKEQGFDVVATAHNLNDQAETLLMRLLSGTGLEGLAGIRLRREGYIRPLLFAERTAIEEYVGEHQIEFREDLTNQDLRFVRNKIRHQLLPYLEKEFQLNNLNSFLNLGLIIQEWLPTVYEQAAEAFRASVKVESENKFRLDITGYTRYFSQLQLRMLERILSKLLTREVKLGFNQFSDFMKWLNQPEKGSRFHFENEITVRKEKQGVVFERDGDDAREVKLHVEIKPGDSYRNEELGVAIVCTWVETVPIHFENTRLIEYLDAREIMFPLILRNWRAGDRFQPLGASHQKKLSDFLTDEKELIFPKPQMLVLESDGEIVWVVGSRLSEKYKITRLSEKFLKLEVTKL